MKKFFAISLFLLLVACLPISASADGTEYGPYTQGYFKYYVTKSESGDITFLRITDYYGSETAVTVPTYIAGARVDLVESDAFQGSTVKMVYLPAYTVFDPPEGIVAIREGTSSPADDPDNPEEEEPTEPTDPTEPEKPVYNAAYDLNGDKVVNAEDLIHLLKYILQYDVTIASGANPDINGVGGVDLADCVALLRYLCGVSE